MATRIRFVFGFVSPQIQNNFDAWATIKGSALNLEDAEKEFDRLREERKEDIERERLDSYFYEEQEEYSEEESIGNLRRNNRRKGGN